MIFVTGGTGLLGAHLLVSLSKKKEKIKAIYRDKKRIERVRSLFRFYEPERGDQLFEQIEWVYGDIVDLTSLENAMQDCTHVYHCAAMVSFHKNDFNKLFKVNREGTANVVNLCLHLGVQKLCYVSSTAAIGGVEGKTITEKSKWKRTPTTTGYSLAKYSAEKEVWRGIEEGLNAVIVNPCVILGPGNWDESSLTIFRNLKKGSRFYPPGSNATVDARDVTEIMIQLMESPVHSERYLCIGSNQSFKAIITEITRQMGVKSPTRRASYLLVTVLRILSLIGMRILGKRSAITKETVHNLFSHRHYSAEKVKTRLNYDFYSLRETVDNALNGRLHS